MPVEGQAILALTLWLGFWRLLGHVVERSESRKQRDNIRRLYPRSRSGSGSPRRRPRFRPRELR